MPHEIITLQLGSFANYVGAHYWNFQDDLLGLQEQAGWRGPAAAVDSDTLFRAGETLGGQPTYTPRLVLCDLSGALGGASAGGAFYRDRHQPGAGAGASVVSTWAGAREVHRAAPVPRSRFAEELENEAEEVAEEEGEGGEAPGSSRLAAAAAQLDGVGAGSDGGGGSFSAGVRYWTDYLKAHVHPRSVHQLAGAWHGLTPFSGWGDGGEHWRSEEQREEVMERVRFFAEECDQLQGFQVLADDLSGFGQLAAHMLQQVRDEYGSGRPVVLFALRPGAAAAAAAAGVAPAAADDPAEQRRRRLNEGLSLSLLAPLCSMFVPLAPPAPAPGVLPLLRWQPGNAFHASALCAAALDTATLPYRLLASGLSPVAATGRSSMWDLCQLLTAQHRSPLACLSLSLPCPALPADTQQAAQQADARTQHAGGSGGAPALAAAGAARASSSGGSSQPFTTQWLASFTCGIPAAGGDGCFAESIVLRGARAAGGAAELGAAAEALDASLAAEHHRCVRQRTLAAQPLPVPLPFPHIWARGLSESGDIPAGAAGAALLAGGGSRGGQDIASCAALTRLGGTTAFGPAVAAVQRRFSSAAATAQGQAALEGWGHWREELGGLQEWLASLAHAYDEED
ncbi:hypothetical protein ABPG75_013186 [Micractinium tetrahymenae]